MADSNTDERSETQIRADQKGCKGQASDFKSDQHGKNQQINMKIKNIRHYCAPPFSTKKIFFAGGGGY